MVLEDRAASKFSFECQLQELNGVDLGKTYRNDFSFTNFLHYIDMDIKAKVAEEINRCHAFAIMTDASTSRSITEYEAVCVRYVSITEETQPVIKVHFIGLGEIDLHANADGILKSITEVINSAGIKNWEEKLVCCTVDGTNVNIGQKGGLVKKLGTPSHITCFNHVFDLCVKECIAGSKPISEVISLVRNVSSFYRTSPKLNRELKKAGKALGIDAELLSFKPICDTRWADSLKKSVQPLIRNYKAITNHLEDILSPHSESTHTADIKSTAKGLLNFLSSYQTVFLLFAFADFLEVMSKTSEILESRNITLYSAMSKMKKAVSKLQEFKGDKKNCMQLSEFLMECRRLEDDKWQFKGQILNCPKKRKHINTNLLPWDHAMNFFENFCTILNRRLKAASDSSDMIFKAFQFMDISFMSKDANEMATYGNSHIIEVCKTFGLSTTCADVEWNELKNVIHAHFSQRTDFCRLRTMLQSESLQHLSIMRTLLDILLCIPASNADVERVWSDMKEVIGMKSVSLKKDTLQARLRVKRNGSDISEQDMCGAINLWWAHSINNGRSRRQDFLE